LRILFKEPAGSCLTKGCLDQSWHFASFLLPRSNSVAFGAKRTLSALTESRIYEVHVLADLPRPAGMHFGLSAAGYRASPHNFIGRITIGMFRRWSRRIMVSAASLCS
jgi:hypothetical protein